MIELKNITKTYQSGKVAVEALRGVSLKIAPGEFIAIMGPSGSGKSTLMHVLGFLDRPDSGSYLFAGKETTRLSDDELALARNRLAGFVFQQFHLLPRMNAVENAALPLIYAGKSKLKEQAREKIREVGLQPRALHRPNELSGGEQQRVAIARALVNDPLLILADEPTGNLDTKSEEEIVSLLEDLNRKGKTVVIVTHEKEVGQHAKRIISMRDGVIVADEKMASRREGPAPADVSLDGILSRSGLTGVGAEFLDHFRQAVSAVVSHKMRSMLSMLGILIGVAAVIAMLALGQGAKESISKSLSSLGSNLLTIRPGSHQFHGVSMEAGAVTRFTLADAEAISRLSQIKKVSAIASGRGQVVAGSKNWSTDVTGVGVDYPTMRASIPKLGRFFTEDEFQKREKVALLGLTVAKELFGDADPIGAAIKINRITFRVIGVLPERGASGWRDQDDVVIIPVTTAMYRLLGREYVDRIDAEVKDSALLDDAQGAIKRLVIRRQRLGKDQEDSFQIMNMSEFRETVESTSKTMTSLLGSIAAISLLVGGIGIMNIMLVSVTERTREIGLRMAIGARRQDIMIQFLIESVVMTFAGGIMGILLGAGIAKLLSVFAHWTTVVSTASVILATVFSVTVGIAFGLWPARQAARLNPIEALRYE